MCDDKSNFNKKIYLFDIPLNSKNLSLKKILISIILLIWD